MTQLKDEVNEAKLRREGGLPTAPTGHNGKNN